MNRSERRAAAKALQRRVATHAGVSVKLVGYRIVRADGTVKVQVGQVPGKDNAHDS